MQPQAMPGGTFVLMGNAQFDAQLTFTQAVTQLRVVGEGHSAVELQAGMLRGVLNHTPGLLPATAMDGQG